MHKSLSKAYRGRSNIRISVYWNWQKSRWHARKITPCAINYRGAACGGLQLCVRISVTHRAVLREGLDWLSKQWLMQRVHHVYQEKVLTVRQNSGILTRRVVCYFSSCVIKLQLSYLKRGPWLLQTTPGCTFMSSSNTAQHFKTQHGRCTPDNCALATAYVLLSLILRNTCTSVLAKNWSKSCSIVQ